MTYNFIATWKMAFDGVMTAENILKNGGDIQTAIEHGIVMVEDNPDYHSVGFGGLPNRHGGVELDAAYMDGKTAGLGAIMAVKNIKNPIKVAIKLSHFKRNTVLAGSGAEQYAENNGFEFSNMLSAESHQRWQQKAREEFDTENTEAYGGHDTVCMLGRDSHNNLAVGVSTSGLFMKHPGRVGDSPLIGSGFYCDNRYGAAAATGVGEDIMKGCLSYEIVRRIAAGESPQSACENTLFDHQKYMLQVGHVCGRMSVIASDAAGNFGAATTKKEFPFVVTNDKLETTLLVAHNDEGKIRIVPATPEWLATYVED